MDTNKLLKALKYAINIIRAYETEVKDLKTYLDGEHDIKKFCQGAIFKEAIKDINRIAGI